MPAWIVLLPPIFVLFMVVITKKIHESLFLGIIAAAFIASRGELLGTVEIIYKHTKAFFGEIDNIYLFISLFIIGILVVLIDRTGGARAFAHAITRHIKNARAAETSSILLSLALFVDDYLSNLTVGYVMQNVTDRFQIPRAKLAYLIHSVSIPLIIITPLSSWMAMITDQLYQSGVAPQANASTKIIADPFFTYISTIPYIFYSFFALISLFFIVRMRLSFGPMKQEEITAKETAHDDCLSKTIKSSDSVIDLVLPIATLIITFIGGILYTGGYCLMGGTHSFFEAFNHSDQTFLALLVAGIASLIIGFSLALGRKKIPFKAVPNIIFEGSMLMLSPVLMLMLSSILGRIIRLDLKTGIYLAQLVSNVISISLLPFIFFIITTIASTLMGSSWATIALFLPIAIPMIITVSDVTSPALPSQLLLLYPMLGAIFSGAVCGDNLSPISQTTLMASTSAGCDPILHVKTQFPYAFPALVCTGLAYLIVGLLLDFPTIRLVASLLIGLILTLTLLFYQNWRANRKLKPTP